MENTDENQDALENEKTLDYILHYKIPENLPLAENALIENGYIQKYKTQDEMDKTRDDKMPDVGTERETGKTYALLTHAYTLLLYDVHAIEAETLAEKISSINQTLDEKIDFYPASTITKFTQE